MPKVKSFSVRTVNGSINVNQFSTIDDTLIINIINDKINHNGLWIAKGDLKDLADAIYEYIGESR